jgi:hypothetical protein
VAARRRDWRATGHAYADACADATAHAHAAVAGRREDRQVPPRTLVLLIAVGLFLLSAVLLQRYSVGEVLLIQLVVVVIVLAWLLRMYR